LFALCLLYLTFVLAAANFQLAGISIDAGSKESRREGVRAAKSPSPREPLADIETTTPHDTSMLETVLVSRCAGTVNHDAICGMLAECLHDVHSAMFAMPYLVVLMFPCFFVLGCKID
jgi:hypothetical protein